MSFVKRWKEMDPEETLVVKPEDCYFWIGEGEPLSFTNPNDDRLVFYATVVPREWFEETGQLFDHYFEIEEADLIDSMEGVYESSVLNEDGTDYVFYKNKEEFRQFLLAQGLKENAEFTKYVDDLVQRMEDAANERDNR